MLHFEANISGSIGVYIGSIDIYKISSFVLICLHCNMGRNLGLFFVVSVKDECLLFKYRQQNLDVRPCSEAQSNTP